MRERRELGTDRSRLGLGFRFAPDERRAVAFGHGDQAARCTLQPGARYGRNGRILRVHTLPSGKEPLGPGACDRDLLRSQTLGNPSNRLDRQFVGGLEVLVAHRPPNEPAVLDRGIFPLDGG